MMVIESSGPVGEAFGGGVEEEDDEEKDSDIEEEMVSCFIQLVVS